MRQVLRFDALPLHCLCVLPDGTLLAGAGSAVIECGSLTGRARRAYPCKLGCAPPLPLPVITTIIIGGPPRRSPAPSRAVGPRARSGREDSDSDGTRTRTGRERRPVIGPGPERASLHEARAH